MKHRHLFFVVLPVLLISCSEKNPVEHVTPNTSIKKSTVAASGVETLILFDAALNETPESIVFDRDDNAYITLSNLGEIRKIAPDLTQTTLAFMPTGAPCGTPKPALALGLALDEDDELFVAVTACDPANQGIWKVDKNSSPTPHSRFSQPHSGPA